MVLSSTPTRLRSSSSPPDSHFESMSRSAQIDQTGCSTATGLLCSIAKWANDAGVIPNRLEAK